MYGMSASALNFFTHGISPILSNLCFRFFSAACQARNIQTADPSSGFNNRLQYKSVNQHGATRLNRQRYSRGLKPVFFLKSLRNEEASL